MGKLQARGLLSVESHVPLWWPGSLLPFSSSVTLAHSAQLSDTPLSSHCRRQLSPAVHGCCAAADWEAGVGNAHDLHFDTAAAIMLLLR